MDEIPVIKNAIDNILLARANEIKEKMFEEFKTQLMEKFNMDNLPMDNSEIYSGVSVESNRFLVNLLEKIEQTLRPTQVAELIVDVLNKVFYQCTVILDVNKKIQDEWYDDEYNNLIKNLKIEEVNFIFYHKLTHMEDISEYCIKFTEDWIRGITKFLDVPNDNSKSN